MCLTFFCEFAYFLFCECANTYTQREQTKQTKEIRCLAIRLLTRIPGTFEHLHFGYEITKCFKDNEPSVRKAAVQIVPLYFEQSKEQCKEYGLIKALQKMLIQETNQNVLSAVIVCLKEISEMQGCFFFVCVCVCVFVCFVFLFICWHNP